MPKRVCSNFISALLKSELNNWPNRFHYVSLIVLLCVKKKKKAATIDAAVAAVEKEGRGRSLPNHLLIMMSHPATRPSLNPSLPLPKFKTLRELITGQHPFRQTVALDLIITSSFCRG